MTRKTPPVGLVTGGDERIGFLKALGLDKPRDDWELRAAFLAPLLGKNDALLAMEGIAFPGIICPQRGDRLVVAEWGMKLRPHDRMIVRVVLDRDNMRRYWDCFEKSQQMRIFSVVYEFEENDFNCLSSGDVLVDVGRGSWQHELTRGGAAWKVMPGKVWNP